MQVFAALFRSRKFLTLVLDAVISMVTLIVSLSFSPEIQDVVQQVIVILQPVVLAVIGAWAVEDAAQKFGSA